MNRATFTQTATDLRIAAKAYYDTDVETMTDAAYDQGIEALRIAVAENPSWATEVADLLTLVAAGQSSGGDVEHTSLMGSMDKANTLEAVTAFMAKVTGTVVVEPKMDGLAVAATYTGGKLVSLVTRGDGRTGEDGAIQGLLELAGIPYVGCDIAGSAICMDKSLAYLVARAAGIPTPEFAIVGPGEDPGTDDPGTLEYPVFVKPARSGSSFGVRRVDAPDGLAAAIADARRYDTKVLVEQAVVGSEVGCAVLGDAPELVVGEVDRIALAHGFFRIHQEDSPETGSENAVITVPADLPAETRARIQATAKRIYTALGCRGLARVDMFLEADGRIVLNEVNTLPGFTSYSRYPRMMRAAGIGLAELVDRSLVLALGR